MFEKEAGMADKTGLIFDKLIDMFSDYDISELQFVMDPSMADTDIIESGIIDSMGLLTMQGAIEEVFDVRIPKVVFIAELRCLRAITEYLSENMTAEKQSA